MQKTKAEQMAGFAESDYLDWLDGADFIREQAAEIERLKAAASRTRKEACFILCHSTGELDGHVQALGQQGYRIIQVIVVYEGVFGIIAQEL